MTLELFPYHRDEPLALNKTDLKTHGKCSATRYVHEMVLNYQLHARSLKTACSGFNSLVCLGDAPMMTHVLQPGSINKELQPAIRILGILHQSPRQRPTAPAHRPDLLHGRRKRGCIC